MSYIRMLEDAQQAIHNLMAQNERLRKERDAAVEELDEIRLLNLCNSCKHNESVRFIPPGEYACSGIICAYEKRCVQKED